MVHSTNSASQLIFSFLPLYIEYLAEVYKASDRKTLWYGRVPNRGIFKSCYFCHDAIK